jgi:hypothetical protein
MGIGEVGIERCGWTPRRRRDYTSYITRDKMSYCHKGKLAAGKTSRLIADRGTAILGRAVVTTFEFTNRLTVGSWPPRLTHGG